jgi:ATP-dependent Clp protease ATP-binding subunit ClpC
MKTRRSTRRQFLKETTTAALAGAVWSGVGSANAQGSGIPHSTPLPDYSRFTDRARKVMRLASEAAQDLHGGYLRTEHILIGMLLEGAGVAAHILQDFDVDLRKVRTEVERLVQSMPEAGKVDLIRLTPRAENVIAFSTLEARDLNQNYVGTEHLLLGLVREKDGIAAEILINLGAKLADLRNGVLHLLGHDL